MADAEKPEKKETNPPTSEHINIKVVGNVSVLMIRITFRH